VTIRDENIFKIIEQLSQHYQYNLYNRYVRKALMVLNLSHATWGLIEDLTGKVEYFKTQGYQFAELYEQIIAAKTLVIQAKREVLPNLKTILAGGSDTVLQKKKKEDERDKIIREMAIHNFPANLEIFDQMLDKLFNHAALLDRSINKKPVYTSIPELKQLGFSLP